MQGEFEESTWHHDGSETGVFNPKPLEMSGILQLTSFAVETAAVHTADGWAAAVKLDLEGEGVPPEYAVTKLTFMLRATDIQKMAEVFTEAAALSNMEMAEAVASGSLECGHDHD